MVIPKRIVLALVCFNALVNLQYGYSINGSNDTKTTLKNSILRIYKDKDCKDSIQQSTIDETLYINLKGLDFNKTDSVELLIDNTKVKMDSIDATVFSFPLSRCFINHEPFSAPFKMVTWRLGTKKRKFQSEQFKIIFRPYIFASPNGTAGVEAKPDDQIWVHSELKPDLTGYNIFINEYPVSIGNLITPANSDGSSYYFILKNKISNTDSLSNLFNPLNKDTVCVKVSIGTTFNSRKEINSKLVIVFDEWRCLRQSLSLSVAAIVLIIVFTILYCTGLKLLRDTSTTLTKPPFSLAKTQMAFWTVLVLVAYFFIWYQTGSLIHITTQVLILLGISAGSYFSATIIDNNDIANPKIVKRHQDSKGSKIFLMNILSDQSGISIHRVQNVVFTVAIGGYFLHEVIINKAIPELDGNLTVLMGISSATYVAVKQGENKSFQDEIVG